jgi:hypothetical protein
MGHKLGGLLYLEGLNIDLPCVGLMGGVRLPSPSEPSRYFSNLPYVSMISSRTVLFLLHTRLLKFFSRLVFLVVGHKPH